MNAHSDEATAGTRRAFAAYLAANELYIGRPPTLDGFLMYLLDEFLTGFGVGPRMEGDVTGLREWLARRDINPIVASTELPGCIAVDLHDPREAIASRYLRSEFFACRRPTKSRLSAWLEEHALSEEWELLGRTGAVGC
ncbi:MAG: hypothetical protein IE923_07750 [Micrococcales bacterium]|nr:hypothetical protein [Micrococcales bacterium]